MVGAFVLYGHLEQNGKNGANLFAYVKLPSMIPTWVSV